MPDASSTLKSSARVSAAVMASRVLGVVRDSLFAGLFGTTWVADAYVIAFRIPNLLRDLFAEGAVPRRGRDFVPSPCPIPFGRGEVPVARVA